jgi:hypothetical protein
MGQAVGSLASTAYKGQPSAGPVVLLLVFGVPIDVIVAEVLVHHSVLEHVVGGREHGAATIKIRLLGRRRGFDIVEIDLQVVFSTARS